MSIVDEALKEVDPQVRAKIVEAVRDRIVGDILRDNESRIAHVVAETASRYNEILKKELPL